MRDFIQGGSSLRSRKFNLGAKTPQFLHPIPLFSEEMGNIYFCGYMKIDAEFL